MNKGIPQDASESLARAIGSARKEILGRGIVREQADLLIEDVVESYQREIVEFATITASQRKDIFNLRETVIWLNEMLDENRGGD
ncbi:MAG: hypothetical protein DMG44_10605 [Acidobacteria bacterium]|nr:MAG: hypothetical protein DMG44_10605 [Acidobacteriota bacterium]